MKDVTTLTEPQNCYHFHASVGTIGWNGANFGTKGVHFKVESSTVISMYSDIEKNTLTWNTNAKLKESHCFFYFQFLLIRYERVKIHQTWWLWIIVLWCAAQHSCQCLFKLWGVNKCTKIVIFLVFCYLDVFFLL